jgi:hypothetical protein
MHAQRVLQVSVETQATVPPAIKRVGSRTVFAAGDSMLCSKIVILISSLFPAPGRGRPSPAHPLVRRWYCCLDAAHV